VNAAAPIESRLRIERKRRRLSVKHVAAVIGCAPSNLSRLEVGEHTPARDIARKLYAFYRGRVRLGEIYDPTFQAETDRATRPE
jgi:transcriptional regulator with XRE-family HTH domain